jgi:hypothetical protein
MQNADIIKIAMEYYEKRDTREPEPLQGPPREHFLKAIHS